MSDAIDQHEEALFDAALKLPPAARADYLRQACDGDDALRKRIESLIAAHGEAGAFLEGAADPTPCRTTSYTRVLEEKTGDRIGRYKLLQQIGEGGCGVVYMAEQEEPVRRRVALKVIKLGMDTRQVIARFEAERQAVALMDHPNIAHVLDAGATEKGSPFFVMELVRGVKITDYCDQHKLPTVERLKLFVQVCMAIQHAHQKGIIHRDIKPSNILVTLHDGVPVPKVIDFGIAKATQGRLTDQTLFTAFEQFMGTPAYMSPEQAEMSGLDVDTRSDIYALGVLLYEMLTGHTPFDGERLIESGIDGMRRIIREQEPARPSTRLSSMLDADQATVALRRQSDGPRLINVLRGDLDWIVMKTLEKDRTRRYETASALAADVQRYLHREPVLARPPSNLYKLQKMVWRNPTATLAIGGGLIALVAGFAASLYFYFQEHRALQRAIAAEQLQVSLREKAEALAATEALMRRGAEIGQKISGAGLGLASGHYEESERLIMQTPPMPVSASIYSTLGGWHAVRGEWPGAVTNYALVVQVRPDDFDGYNWLAGALLHTGDFPRYHDTCAKMLKEFADTKDPKIAAMAAKDCMILPPAPDQLPTLAHWTDVAVADGPRGDLWPQSALAKSLLEYRRGQFADAATWAQKAIHPEGKPDTSGQGYWDRNAAAWMVLAMADQALGKTADARDALATGQALSDRIHASDVGWFEWNDRAVAEFLGKEAHTMLPGAAVAK